jgi:RNA polymerase primary sigma factor
MDRSVKYLATICLFMTAEHNGVEGMAMPTRVTTTSKTTVGVVSTSSSLSSPVVESQQLNQDPLHFTRWEAQYYNKQEEDDDDDDDDDDEDVLDFMEVDSFQELQRSLGTDVLDDQLQQQIDQALMTSPNLFLDAHISDASYLEKVAMSSIPEQLPLPAVNALRRTTKHKIKKKNTGAGLQRSTAQRITPDEEIELAKMIQRGVKLFKIKADHHKRTNGQTLNKQEWAKLAGLESATQLRREVATYRRAKQLLVSANVGLVHAVVKKQFRGGSSSSSSSSTSASGLSFDELVQEGSLGLLRAAELFDPSRGLRFSTYATIWIKGQLSNSHTMEIIKLPARERTKWNKIVKAHEELVREKGLVDAEPTVEEVAKRIGMNAEDVLVFQRKMKQARQFLSLDYEYQQQSRSGTDSYGSGNVFENDKSFQSDADLAERTQMQADVIAAMAQNLTPREARLMRLRYGLTDGQTRSLRECAEAMGLSETRVQQLSKACLKKLREAAEAESLDEYLLTIA